MRLTLPFSRARDVSLQRRIGRNHAARSARTLGDRRRAGQLGLDADLHALHAIGPAGNDLAQRKFNRLVARRLVGAVDPKI